MSELLYLIADIGATHARFQCCELDDRVGPLLIGEPLMLATQDFSDVDALLAVVNTHWPDNRFARALICLLYTSDAADDC